MRVKWEYRVVVVERFLDDMREFSNNGWELVAVCNDLAYFKRPLEEEDISDSRKVASILISDLSKRDDITSKGAADFISNTIGIANTILNTGWQFEPGADLIKDILCPQFTEAEND